MAKSIPEIPTPILSQSNIRSLIISIIAPFNFLLTLAAQFLLVFQTIYILKDKEPKYINLRHMTIKWIFCLAFHQIKSGYLNNPDLNSQVMAVILNFLILFIAYPSKVLKAVHLKYFSHKENQKYNQSVNDPNSYDITFSNRVLAAIAVALLNCSKHIIAFVPPMHRRNVEEALKNVNAVVVDRKCFWSIYEKKNIENADFSKQNKQKSALKQYLLSGAAPNAPNASMREMRESTLKQSINISNIIRASGQQCSNHMANAPTKYKAIKKVEIKYKIATAQFEVIDIDFDKTNRYILEEVVQKQENVIEFIVVKAGNKFNESILIKFKSGKQMDNFISAIEDSERMYE